MEVNLNLIPELAIIVTSLAVIVESVCEITSSSALFGFQDRAEVKKFRDKWGRLGYLATCGYCQSVWFAQIFVFLAGVRGLCPQLGMTETVGWGFVVHRLSNIWHELISRWMKRIWTASQSFHTHTLSIDNERPQLFDIHFTNNTETSNQNQNLKNE